MVHLSVIFPCYNEERRLPASLARVRAYLAEQPYSWEILIVDDGSRDATLRLAQEASAEDPRIQALSYGENRGKGGAVQYGALRASGKHVLFTDADLSTPIEELEKFLPQAERGYDVVIASRALAESNITLHQPWWRERAGRAMNRCIRFLSGLKYVDTQCGFKLFTRAAARDIFQNLRVRGWMFDVEALVLAQRLGYRIIDVPVTWVNNEDSRVKGSDLPRVFRELLQIRYHWLRHQPERLPSEPAEERVEVGAQAAR